MLIGSFRHSCGFHSSSKFSGAPHTHPMPQLHLLIFKRRSYFPKNGGHWALFLPFEKGGTDGCGFDVIKSSFKAKQTQFKTFDCTPEVGKDRLVECVPLEIYVDDVPDLNNICNIVTRGRPF